MPKTPTIPPPRTPSILDFKLAPIKAQIAYEEFLKEIRRMFLTRPRVMG